MAPCIVSCGGSIELNWGLRVGLFKLVVCMAARPLDVKRPGYSSLLCVLCCAEQSHELAWRVCY